MYTRFMYAMTLWMMLVSWTEGFIESAVNDYDHAIHLYNQYLTLL